MSQDLELDMTTAEENSGIVYYAGYLFVNWLDNYGEKSGDYTASSGGRISDLNYALSKMYTQYQDPDVVNTAMYNVYGKTAEELLAEFKAEIAAPETYEEFVKFCEEKLNIQCDDGLNDALSNSDNSESDSVPNEGIPLAISETNVIPYDRRKITIFWGFVPGDAPNVFGKSN
jgi:hypothetical protein